MGVAPEKSPKLRDRQRQATDRRVKQRALKLFTKRGFDATTTKAIADAAGVSHGTVFRVAPTKEALLVVAYEERLQETFDQLRAAMPAKNLRSQLRHLCSGLFEFYGAHPDLSHTFVRALLFYTDPVCKAEHDTHVGGFQRFLVQLLSAAKERGELAADSDPSAGADIIFAIYQDTIIRFLNSDERDPSTMKPRFLRLLRQTLASYE